MSATSFNISWLEAAVGWIMGGVINGGDFNCDFSFVAVTQEDKEEDEDEARVGSGRAILRDPGPGLAGVSGMTLTSEKTGTVTVLDETDGEAVADLKEPYAELAAADLREEDSDLRVP